MQWGYSESQLILQIILAAFSLFFGRRLFWVFVGGTGFIVGFQVVQQFFTPDQYLMMLTFATIAGFAGMLLAVFFKKAAIVIVGALSAGTAAYFIFSTFIISEPWVGLVFFIVGGIFGGWLANFFFDFGIILLSSSLGAVTIARLIPADEQWKMIAAIGLLLVGISYQYNHLSRSQKDKNRG
ncbi:MAG: hypothetical protein KC713_05290 [Candidatus Omnitrophica bacterium]|nr:hypothetical protein [Candidatus Omnitrophota bacterium]